jgi:maleate isomerase
MAMWQPDGWAQTRIGVLTPHADVWPEAEFGAMATDGISIHAARVPFGAYKSDGTMDRTIADDPVRAFADPPLVDDAAELLASAPLHAIAYGFTSSSYVRGAADDAKLKERLERRTRGIPVVISCAAGGHGTNRSRRDTARANQSALVLGRNGPPGRALLPESELRGCS